MTEFTLTIKLGNDAMSGAHDIANALLDASRRIRNAAIEPGECAMVRDVNGNIVGSWGIN